MESGGDRIVGIFLANMSQRSVDFEASLKFSDQPLESGQIGERWTSLVNLCPDSETENTRKLFASSPIAKRYFWQFSRLVELNRI